MRKWMFVDRKQCALFCASSGQHGTYCVGNVTRETGFILMILPAKRPRCKSVITQGYRRWIGQKIADFLLPRHSRRCWTWQPRDDCQLATDSVFFSEDLQKTTWFFNRNRVPVHVPQNQFWEGGIHSLGPKVPNFRVSCMGDRGTYPVLQYLLHLQQRYYKSKKSWKNPGKKVINHASIIFWGYHNPLNSRWWAPMSHGATESQSAPICHVRWAKV